MTVLGQTIRGRRLAMNLSQRALAESVGVGGPHISNIEAGKENPSDALLAALAAALHWDSDELFVAARRLPPDILDVLFEDPVHAMSVIRVLRVVQRRRTEQEPQ